LVFTHTIIIYRMYVMREMKSKVFIFLKWQWSSDLAREDESLHETDFYFRSLSIFFWIYFWREVLKVDSYLRMT
jgi:hypothetical protein